MEYHYSSGWGVDSVVIGGAAHHGWENKAQVNENRRAYQPHCGQREPSLGTRDDKDKKNINMMRVRSTLANMYTVFCVVVVVLGISSLVAVGMGLRPFVMISESMHPEVPKNALVILNTSASFDEVRPGDNVAYVLGKVEAMHKVTAISPVSTISTDAGENESNMTTETVENGESGEKTLVVKSLSDEGTSVVTADTYLGREVLSIPAVGGWIRKALDYKWIVIGIAGLLVVAGCIPQRNKS